MTEKNLKKFFTFFPLKLQSQKWRKFFEIYEKSLDIWTKVLSEKINPGPAERARKHFNTNEALVPWWRAMYF